MHRRLMVVAVTFACQFGTAQMLMESFTSDVFPPPGWAVYNRDGGLNQVERRIVNYNTPPACAFCFGEADRQADDWLCTPALYPQGGDTILRWWFRAESTGHRESISVWVSTTTQEPDSFTQFVQGFGCDSNGYQPESVSLAQFAGQRVFVALVFNSDTTGMGVGVDDVSGPSLYFRDVGATAIVAPVDTIDSGTVVTPQVVVRNHGTRADTFPVTLRIGLVYDRTVSGVALEPGQEDTVDFPGWVAEPEGWHTTLAFTGLAADQDPTNDTVGPDTIYVIPPERHDVGVTYTIAPTGIITFGTAVVPTVIVRNFQTRTETFPVTLRVGSVYNRTVSGITLTPGQSQIVAFPDTWVAAPAGFHDVVAFTGLAGDQNRANDTFVNRVLVIQPPTVTLTIPNGGEVWQSGSSHTIAWTHGGGQPDGDSLWYRTSDSTPWIFIHAVGPGRTSYQWNPVPHTPSRTCRVLVKAYNFAGGSQDSSDGWFAITYQDVGATAILAPADSIDSGTVVTPRAIVRNYGSDRETFPVTFRIGSVYDQTLSTVALDPGQIDTVDFPDWVAEPEGRHTTLAFTNLLRDQDRTNDTVAGPDVLVVPPERHDVGVTYIVAPTGIIDSGTAIVPMAVVHNFQTRTETFPVTLRIGSVYDRTVSGVTLLPGESRLVVFPDTWVAEPEGFHDVVAFTGLDIDQNRSNDTFATRVLVVPPPRHDVGATAILAPVGTIDSGTIVTPMVVVQNFQTRTETFPVTIRIGSVYDQTVTGVTLYPGYSDTVYFPDWVAEPEGSFEVVAFTSLDIDEDRSNDTVYSAESVRVIPPERHDVGATAILAPTGTLDSGAVVTPRAAVYNFGTRVENFPVTFSIGTGYLQTVPATLAPGQTDTVSFPDWTAEPVGIHMTMAFTGLDLDRDRTNDTVRGSVTVDYPPRHDVGAVAILAPLGTVDSGVVFTPMVVVQNFQTRVENFPVTFRIGSVYDQTVTGVTLVPGQVDTVGFPVWVAQPLGIHPTLAFTSLDIDENRANDTTRNQVTVQLPERHDVGATAILAPVDTVDSGVVVTPRAVVRNFQTRTETFPVTFRIGSLYDRTVTGVTLMPGQVDTVDFPDWVAEPAGRYATLAFTSLAGDQNRANDTTRNQVTVQLPERHDVGATAILAPIDTVDSGATVTPTAVVYNFGTREEVFPVTFRIGSGYDQTITNVRLSPGQTDTLSFPVWTAEPVGSHLTLAFTSLAGDRDRANDTVRSSVTVVPPPRHDVGATAIIAPVDTVDSGEVLAPNAVVHNYGTRTETFPVRFTIEGGYDQTVSATLAAGETDTLGFPVWTAQPLGRLEVVAFTSLAGDENRSNDTVRAAVTVQARARRDVGAIAVLAPTGTVDSGSVVTPRAVVYNFGTRPATFPVRFTIEGGYNETLGVTLAMGETDTLDFPGWTAHPLGDLGVAAFTELDDDENRANDTATERVTVQRPARHDVGATAVLAPVGTVDSGTMVTPVAIIYNYGTRDEVFPVTLSIDEAVSTALATGRSARVLDNVYRETVQRMLTPGQEDTVSFPGWVAQPVGRYLVSAFTALDSDENRANDTADAAEPLEVVYPERHDVGATAILAPRDTVDSGATVTPTAVVHNFGTRAELFPVVLRIGSVYDQTVTGVSLAPGQTDTVGFPDWVAGPVGDHPLLSFTVLAGDGDRSNDSVFGADTLGAPETLHVVLPERHDVAATIILAPLGRVDSASQVTPLAVVQNLGTRDEAEFQVTFTIGSRYAQTVTTGLGAGQTDTLDFPTWTAEEVGVLSALCYTGLAGDENRANDTVRSEVRVVLVADVGAEAVLAPVGAVKLTEGITFHTVSPRARLANYGQTSEAGFEVRFRIDSVMVYPGPETTHLGTAYEQTASVGLLAAGGRLEISFPDVELPFGHYAVSCSTRLATDADSSNNRAAEHYFVEPFQWNGPGELQAVIYTRAGERVRTLSRRLREGDALLVQWDGANGRGSPCAPGVYICRLRLKPDQGEAQHQSFKLLVTTDFAGMVLTWR